MPNLIPWALCGRDWQPATAQSAGVEPVLSPPAVLGNIADELELASKSADLVYLNLHGYPGQPYYLGQDGDNKPTALSAELVASFDWSGVVVFAEVCWSAADGGSPIARAFLDRGARAFVGSTSEAYGRINRVGIFDGEADRLGHLFRLALGHNLDPQRALDLAKRWLRFLSYPLDELDRATLESFICLRK